MPPANVPVPGNLMKFGFWVYNSTKELMFMMSKPMNRMMGMYEYQENFYQALAFVFTFKTKMSRPRTKMISFLRTVTAHKYLEHFWTREVSNYSDMRLRRNNETLLPFRRLSIYGVTSLLLQENPLGFSYSWALLKCSNIQKNSKEKTPIKINFHFVKIICSCGSVPSNSLCSCPKSVK